jgi:serine/threonine protein kinase
MTNLGEPIGIAAVSRYRFLHHLATGGMAEIYAAEAIGVAGANRRVAVKRVLREHAEDESFRSMFTNEARLAVRLQHPNIVQTYDVLDVRGELYITMELLEGLGLLDLLRLLDGPEPALTPPQAVYIVDKVLAGLHYAHELADDDGEPLGLVHRDVSPHNVFLTHTGNVKLIDFGIAKLTLGAEHTDTGKVKGKVLYMSPEHCQAQPVDRRSDLFSAGLLLYTLLTNHHPFKRANIFKTMKALIHEPLPPVTARRPDLPAALDGVLDKALAKKPDDRFTTANDFRVALAAIVREHGWYLTDNEFSRLVQDEAPTIERDGSEELPPDLVFSAPVPEVHTGRHPAANAALAETPHATVERLFGVILVRLHGVFNETFDPEPLLPHIKGDVLIDSAGVEAITSYGIRGLLRLYEQTPTDSITHYRCSVAFLQQVEMVRHLLGGGRIVSFHLPYIDPVTGTTFNVLVGGAAAATILETREPPLRTCPGFPDRDARFDEDPQTFLAFGDAFQAEPDEELRAILDGLAAEQQSRQVEKAVDADGTRIWIRRPIQASFRWRNLLEGVEGSVVIDLEDTPSWTEDGIEALASALRDEAENLASLTVLHTPHPFLERLRHHGLDARLTASTCRVHASCASCGTPRRVAVPLEDLGAIRKGEELDRCPLCGGSLQSTERFAGETVAPAPPREVADEPPAAETTDPAVVVDEAVPSWVWVAVALGALGVLILVAIALRM